MKYFKYHRRVGLALALLLSLISPQLVLAQGPVVEGCPILPANNIWNTPVEALPVDPGSDAYIANIGPTVHPHADFGAGIWPPVSGGPIGIPYVVVPANQPLVPITSFLYEDESDPGPYPIPSDAPIEGGPNSTGDRHVLVIRQGECKLYELYRSFPNGDGSWRGDSGAIFDLNSNLLRPDTWTSADAAGLPILPGLARYEEVAAGEINHALRFTVVRTRRDYVWPARHFASDSTDPNRPPLGQRFRLKSNFVIDDSFSSQGRVILRALQKYGMILADNGSNWYISGAPDENWDNDALADDLNRVSGTDFEAVDVSSLMIDPDSGQARATDEFSLAVIPEGQAIDPGAVVTYRLTLTASGNFSAPVTLITASPSPSLTLSLIPSVVTPTAQATLIVTDAHPAGPLIPGLVYNLPLTATGGGLTRTSTAILLVGGTRTYLPLILK